MNTLFIITGAVAFVSAIMTVTRSNAIHALLYMVVSLLSVGMIFYILGAPFAAALEVIIYAGAIMVLFVFVIMMLNINKSRSEEKQWIKPSAWTGPVILMLILATELGLCHMAGDKPGLVRPDDLSRRGGHQPLRSVPARGGACINAAPGRPCRGLSPGSPHRSGQAKRRRRS